MNFDEGIFVGYRFYDQINQNPLFPFRFGLAYTSLKFDALGVETKGDEHTVRLRVTNTGQMAGAEVVQLYLTDPPEAAKPPRQLKGFQEILLKPGENGEVAIRLAADAFSVWDQGTQDWTVYPGTYTVSVVSSSRDIRAKATIAISR